MGKECEFPYVCCQRQNGMEFARLDLSILHRIGGAHPFSNVPRQHRFRSDRGCATPIVMEEAITVEQFSVSLVGVFVMNVVHGEHQEVGKMGARRKIQL